MIYLIIFGRKKVKLDLFLTFTITQNVDILKIQMEKNKSI